MCQSPIVLFYLCINFLRIKEICVISFNSEEELIPHLFCRYVIWCFKLKLNENMLIFKIDDLPGEVQLCNVKVIFKLSITVRNDIHLKLGGFHIGQVHRARFNLSPNESFFT